jgi:D-serine dehydratase
MELKTPIHLKSEHEGFLAEVHAAGKLEGGTGKAARLLARLLERHFAQEDEFVFPPLGLLPDLAQDRLEPGMAAAIAMAARLQDEMPNLLAVQRTIVAALEELMTAAEAEGHAELVGYAENLMLHEEMERDVAYPTSIVIGKYLQLRLKP